MDTILGNDVILGAPTEERSVEFSSTLSGIGEEKAVTIYNPLPHPYRVVFSVSRPSTASPNEGLKFAREKAGLPLEKANSVQHFTESVVLPAQSLKRLPGHIAQKVVRDLTTFIIQTRNDDGSWSFDGRGGNKGMVPDPYLRSQVEQEIIKKIEDTMSFFNQETVNESTQRQISELNDPVKEVVNEPTDPAPGTGINYTPSETLSTGAGQPDTTQSGPLKAAANPA